MALLTLFPIDIHIIKAHKDKITYIAELQNGNLVSSTIKGEIKIWKIKSNSYLCLKILENENNDRINMVIPFNGNRFASCSDDKTITIWESTFPFSKKQILKKHKESVDYILELSNNNQLVSYSSNSDICFWKNDDYALVQSMDLLIANKITYMKVIAYDKIALSFQDRKKGSIIIININNYHFSLYETFIGNNNDSLYWNNTVTSMIMLDNLSIICGCGDGSLCRFNIFEGVTKNKTEFNNLYQQEIKSIIDLGNRLLAITDKDSITFYKY